MMAFELIFRAGVEEVVFAAQGPEVTQFAGGQGLHHQGADFLTLSLHCATEGIEFPSSV